MPEYVKMSSAQKITEQSRKVKRVLFWTHFIKMIRFVFKRNIVVYLVFDNKKVNLACIYTTHTDNIGPRVLMKDFCNR